jgi:hypothetical protein
MTTRTFSSVAYSNEYLCLGYEADIAEDVHQEDATGPIHDTYTRWSRAISQPETVAFGIQAKSAAFTGGISDWVWPEIEPAAAKSTCTPQRLDFTLEAGQKVFQIVVKAERESSSSATPSLKRGVFGFAQLHAALAFMRSRDEGEDMYIDFDTYMSAKNVANLMAYLGLRTPKVFSHGRESVVFTWSVNGLEFYLTVGEGHASAMEIDRNYNERSIGSASLKDGKLLGLVEDLGEQIAGQRIVLG